MGAVRFQVKPGSAISWPGVITIDGVDDFTGYTLACQVRSVDPLTGDYSEDPLADADIDWVDAPNGALLIFIDADVTAEWAVGTRCALDIKVTTPGGDPFHSETAFFEVVRKVTA